MSNRQQNKPSLRTLSFILRNRDLWPKELDRWDYRNCSRCAMGIAHLLWPSSVRTPSCGDMSNAFNLGPDVAVGLFTGTVEMTKGAFEITPEIVADRIDRYLENVGKE